jgi:hypothetical protein
VAKRQDHVGKKRDPRKKRTRSHIIADLSLVFVQYFVVNAGFTSEATTSDYGYDMTVNTFDADGLIEPGSILIQLKATDALVIHPDGISCVFDLDVKDYNLWKDEPNPVFFILFDARARRAFWLYFQQHIKQGDVPKPKGNAKTIRLLIPMANKVRTSFFRHARHLKAEVLKKLEGVDLHG